MRLGALYRMVRDPPQGFRMIQWLRKAFVLSAVLGMASCSSGNPASPPAPPAELPSALRFPSDLGINVDKVSSQPSSGALASFTSISESRAAGSGLAALVGAGGQYSNFISAAPNIVQTFNQFVNILLQPVSQSDIPVSTSTTTFETTFNNVSSGESVAIKIDFADFDSQGCVGHTAGLPICYRIWFNGQQFMAGLFTKFPTAENPGAGRFRVIGHSPAHGPEPAHDLYVGVLYDQDDPLAKSMEFFERGVLAGDSAGERDFTIPDVHADVSQAGPDATAKKTLGYSASALENSSGVIEPPGRFIEQWREDSDFWSGSFFQQGEPFNFSDVCAVISTGNRDPLDDPNDSSDPNNCTDLGIDVDGTPFVNLVTTADVALPADFPLSPTF